MATMRPKSDAGTLLALWEGGIAADPVGRSGALLLAASRTQVLPSTLGELNVQLLELHAWLFGTDLDLLSSCPACGTVAEFRTDCAMLATQGAAAAQSESHRLEADGYRIHFRLPGVEDVAAAANQGPPDAFTHNLLDLCVLASSRGDVSVPVDDLPMAVLESLSERMESLDPAASLSFELECPVCAASWTSGLDVAQLVWQKVQDSAERVLLEIDVLARAYGWTEREVLGLSRVRRAAYLQMAGG